MQFRVCGSGLRVGGAGSRASPRISDTRTLVEIRRINATTQYNGRHALLLDEVRNKRNPRAPSILTTRKPSHLYDVREHEL